MPAPTASAWSTSTSRWCPRLTAAENLVISRADAPAIIDWGKETQGARRVHGARCRSACRSNAQVSSLSAGEKQKLEILKLLYLDQRFMILDEPTSVLTPGEADEMLGPARRHGGAQGNHRADDLPQVPRGEGVLRPASPCCAAAASPASATRKTASVADMSAHDDRRHRRSASAPAARKHNESTRRARTGRPLRRGQRRAARRSRRSTSRSRPARSSASPACPATASRRWSRCCRGQRPLTDGAHLHPRRAASSPSAAISTASRCSACPRSR